MGWAYFQYDDVVKGVIRIYRWPDDGKWFLAQPRQSIECISRARIDQGWETGHWEFLFDELKSGWFSEKQDRITEEKAMQIIEQWKEEKRTNAPVRSR